jgi:fused signal recognition particle receptor
MFGKLKEKIHNWTKKISEKKEVSEEIVEEQPEKEIDFERLQKKAEKINTEIHLEQSLDKQLRGGTIGEGLKYLDGEKPAPGTKSFFKKIGKKISKIKISEKEFKIYAEELEMLLLENNVALEVVEKIIKDLQEKIVGKELLKKEIESEIKDAIKEIIEEILIEPFDLSEKIKEKTSDQAKEPYVVLFCGINGSGKTTTVAKIADSLKNKGISCVIAAADTFRAASIEQIKEHGKKIEVKVISHDYGSDPASVGYDAIKYAKKNFIDCVLIDTAGRMHTAKNLLKEIEKISRICKPDSKLFVGESITGNDAIEQARSFDWAVGLDGIILTKADIDEKGGTALSVGYVTKKPILYLGTGQAYDKIVVFDKQKFIKRLGL